MFCEHCGEELNDDQKFCTRCGWPQMQADEKAAESGNGKKNIIPEKQRAEKKKIQRQKLRRNFIIAAAVLLAGAFTGGVFFGVGAVGCFVRPSDELILEDLKSEGVLPQEAKTDGFRVTAPVWNWNSGLWEAVVRTDKENETAVLYQKQDGKWKVCSIEKITTTPGTAESD